MLPIARVLVEIEYNDFWSWFINILAEDLRLQDDLGWTVISDQQKVKLSNLSYKNYLNYLLLYLTFVECPM